MTPNSSLIPYITAQDVITRVDNVLLGTLVQDGGALDSSTALLTNPVLQACMQDASGQLEAACVQGQRYQPSDLANLTGVSQSFMKRILTFLTLYHLHMRRPGAMIPPGILKAIADAEKWLDNIQEGKYVFAFQETEAAGLTGNEFINYQQQIQLPLITNQIRFWGNRYSHNYPNLAPSTIPNVPPGS
jgi:hypothetical protein